MVALCLVVAALFTLVSCDDDMDIQQSYPFTVEVMPVPSRMVRRQTVKIRCKLKREDDFSGTPYIIRYLQFGGEGLPKTDNGIALLSNDRYLLKNEKFRLYYMTESDEARNFIVMMGDSLKNSYELEFDFSNWDIKDGGFTAIPIGGFKRVWG